MPVPGDRLADRYRIVARIGAGGMATVHRAHDDRLDRDVAVKTLLPNLAHDPVIAQRFEREARAMAMVADPGLVAVYDVEPGDPATGAEPFVVMELCPGGSLADRLGVGRPMPPDDLVPILVAVATALEALHRAGLVHRDVKPSNILFADRVKLGDFGLVRSETTDATELTDPGTAMGTLAYLAPARLRGEAGGSPADVFALGTVAYLGLTGAMPRPTQSLGELVAAAPFRPPPPSSAAPGLGGAFDEPILRALAVDPGRRPAALDFGIELTTALGRWRRSGGTVATGAIAAAPTSTPSAASAAGDMTPAPKAPDGDTETIPAFNPATTAALPVRPSSAVTSAPPPRTSAARPVPVIGAVALVALALAVLLLLPRLLAGLGPATSSTAVGGPSASAAPSGSAAPSPSAAPSASPTPTAAATPTPSQTIDPVLARLDAVDAAINDAKGGHDGLKGREANDLISLAERVRQDVAAGKVDDALRDARALDRRARDAARDLDAERRDQLTTATRALVVALGG